LEGLRSWYDRNVPIYGPLTEYLERLLKEILDNEAIEYVHIESRIKKFVSLKRKIEDKGYHKPEQVTDFAGAMIVGSALSNVELISKVIERGKEFEIDWDNSLDHSIRLAEDRVGYRGKNYVATFRKKAFKNEDEYNKFKDRRFEIQIMTLLGFSWDKIEHDRNYKTAEKLSEKSDIRRRFRLAAGALELIDYEFDRLSKETELSDPVLNRIVKGDLDLEINAHHLRHYLKLHFNNVPGFVEQFMAPINDLLDELDSMGIKTISDLHEIIKPDINQFKNKYAEVSKPKDTVSFSSLIRDILIINDPNTYFKKAWKHHYSTLDYHCWRVYQKFGVESSGFPQYPELDFEEGGDTD
jgi:putative GTP pyrophosphokinase